MTSTIGSERDAKTDWGPKKVLRGVTLVGAICLLSCGSGARPEPPERTGTSAAAITQSGSGRFQAGFGGCIIPIGTVKVGTELELGSCFTASANKFTLGPSIGIGDALDTETRANTVRTGAQGTLKMGGLCLEGNPSSGFVQLNTCQGTCQTVVASDSNSYNLNCPPSYPGGVGLTNASANGLQEWTWDNGLLRSASFPQSCLTAPNLGSANPALTLAACSAEAIQDFSPLDFNLLFASGLPASFQENVPHPPVAPLAAPPTATRDLQCLDVFLDLETLGDNTFDNFQCNATNAQWFHFDGSGALLTASNTCLGAPGGVGTGVVIEPCTGASEQQWMYSGSTLSRLLGTGTSSQSCIEVANENPAPLTKLQLSSCPASAAPKPGQTWRANLVWPKAKSIQYKDVPVEAGWVQGAQVVSGDFDGNGFSDVAYIFKSDGVAGSVNPGHIDIDVYLSDGQNVLSETHLLAAQRWSNELGGWIDGMQFYAGDFDGDGLDDIAVAFDVSGLIQIDVHRSLGSLANGGFAPPERWDNGVGAVIEGGLWQAGDFDGNGKTDLAYIFSIDGDHIDIDTHLSLGSLANGGFAPPQRWANNQGGWIDTGLHDPSSTFIVGGEAANQFCEACIRQGQWVAGDFNADQRTDLALVFNDGSGHIAIDTHMSSGSLANGGFLWTRAANSVGGWVDTSWWLAQDMDNDGRADIVEFYDTFVDASPFNIGPPSLDVYTSSITNVLVPAGVNSFAGGVWGAMGNSSSATAGAPSPLPDENEDFYRLPQQPAIFTPAHYWWVMGNIVPGGFVHRVGSGFGDLMFVEPGFDTHSNPAYLSLHMAF